MYFWNVKRLFLFPPFESCFWGQSPTVRPALPSSLGKASSRCPQTLAQVTAGGCPTCRHTTLRKEDAPLKRELFPLESAATTGLHSRAPENQQFIIGDYQHPLSKRPFSHPRPRAANNFPSSSSAMQTQAIAMMEPMQLLNLPFVRIVPSSASWTGK